MSKKNHFGKLVKNEKSDSYAEKYGMKIFIKGEVYAILPGLLKTGMSFYRNLLKNLVFYCNFIAYFLIKSEFLKLLVYLLHYKKVSIFLPFFNEKTSIFWKPKFSAEYFKILGINPKILDILKIQVYLIFRVL